MTKTQQDLTLRKGDDLKVTWEVFDENNNSVAASDVDSTIFRAADRYDATPVIEKDDSSTDVSYTDGSSTLEVTVDIVGSDTDSLDIDPTILFNYQLIIQLTDGREFTVAEGNLEVRKKIPTGG